MAPILLILLRIKLTSVYAYTETCGHLLLVHLAIDPILLYSIAYDRT